MNKKYIITTDKKHYKSDYLDHNEIAEKHNLDCKVIAETGLIIDGRVMILDCWMPKHLLRAERRRDCLLAQDLRLLQIRAVETQYKYKSFMKEGD